MRTMKDILGGLGALDDFGAAGVGVAAVGSGGGNNAIGPSPNMQVGTEPLGNLTGAPPWVAFRTYQIVPATALAANQGPTLVVAADRASRLVTFTAPNVGFLIYIGDAGVRPTPGGSGLALPPGQVYQIPIPGNQTIYAITDSPVYLPLTVQVGPLLIGDRERVY